MAGVDNYGRVGQLWQVWTTMVGWTKLLHTPFGEQGTCVAEELCPPTWLIPNFKIQPFTVYLIAAPKSVPVERGEFTLH